MVVLDQADRLVLKVLLVRVDRQVLRVLLALMVVTEPMVVLGQVAQVVLVVQVGRKVQKEFRG
jgi:hypothetical protein